VIQWLLFLHILSVFVFLVAHGVSVFVLFRVRRERDRTKILELLTFSGETTLPMYISMGAIVVFGVLLGLKESSFSHWWIWLAIGILLVTSALMGAVAKPYFARLKTACEIRPTGVPRVSDEELALLLDAPVAMTIAAIGTVGLVAILYLMVFQPGAV
jgi:hypothetical protein